MRKLFLFLLAALLLQAKTFAQINPLVQYLPDNIDMVMHIDMKSLIGKIPGETFQSSPMYRDLMRDDSPLREILPDPAKAGIDLSKGILVAVKQNGSDRYGRNKRVVHVFIKLSDAAKFTDFVRQSFNNDKETNEEDRPEIRIFGTDRILVNQGNTGVGWNNDVFVISTGNSDEMEEEINRYYRIPYPEEDTLAVTSSTENRKDTFDFKVMLARFEKLQRENLFNLLTKKSSNAISDNIRFTQLMQETGDIRIWSYGSINPLTERFVGKGGKMEGLMDKLNLLSGKDKLMVINFENGKIVARTRNYPDEKIAAVFQKYPATNINTGLLKKLPEGKLLALANISFNDQLMQEVWKEYGISSLPDSLKNEIPFDLRKLEGVFSASAMIAVLKVPVVTAEDEQPDPKKSIRMYVVAPIADQSKFQQFRDAVLPLMDSLKKEKGEDYKDPGLYIKNNNELLVLSLSATAATDFLNNPGTGLIPDWAKEFNNHPVNVSIDLGNLLSDVLNTDKPEAVSGSRKELFSKFDRIIINGGQFENGSINTQFEFRFTDKEKNSLEQLFQMAASSMEQRKKYREEWSENTRDTVTTVTIEEVKEEKEPTPPPPPPVPKKKKVEPKKFTPPAIKKGE